MHAHINDLVTFQHHLESMTHDFHTQMHGMHAIMSLLLLYLVASVFFYQLTTEKRGGKKTKKSDEICVFTHSCRDGRAEGVEGQEEVLEDQADWELSSRERRYASRGLFPSFLATRKQC
jgi:hypothetical protein